MPILTLARRSLQLTALTMALCSPSALRALDGGSVGFIPLSGAIGTAAAAADIMGTVTDSTSGDPLPAVDVILLRATTAAIVTSTTTDRFGHFTLHNVASGDYTIVIRLLGFAMIRQPLTISGTTPGGIKLSFALAPSAPAMLAAVQATATPPAIDTRTGEQVLNQEVANAVAPTLTTSAVVQQNVAGAARAPTGEVHINGQHAEYTYYVDGVPVPSGVSGSLNEIFSPEVVDQIAFQTGGWDAEFGNKNAAVINVTTKIPSGGFHLNVGSYVGEFDPSSTTGPNAVSGESMSMSGNSGAWGVFVSGAHQFSDMRLEPVVDDANADKVNNFHNSGTDDFGFGKLQYAASKNDIFDLDVNLSQTKFAVPYDSTGNVLLDDHQHDVNGFINLAWHHQSGDTSSAGASDIFGGLYVRYGSLNYTPGSTDTPSFIFYPDTTTPYNLNEQRYFDTYGIKLDYTIRPAHELEFKVGTNTSATTGHENFVTTAADGTSGPASNSGLSGSDVGVYGETAWSPEEEFEIRTGLRYDAHTAPFAGTQSQLSPRIRLNYFPSTSTTAYVYYGRMFIPTNIEDLRAITSISQAGVATTPTLPERDDWYEGGIIQRLPDAGIIAEFSGFYKHSTPGIDDNTVPGSAIVTDVNISQVWIKGLKSVLQFQGNGTFSGGLNAALTHAYGLGPVTGGFFPTATPEGYFDLDHDQRLSLAGHLNYAPSSRFVASVVDIYGSGLTNALDSTDCKCRYSTSLFAFDPGVKVPPSNIIDFSMAFTFVAGAAVVKPQLNVDNVFDKMYLLKGAFFSGASVGRPREITLRVNIEH